MEINETVVDVTEELYGYIYCRIYPSYIIEINQQEIICLKL